MPRGRKKAAPAAAPGEAPQEPRIVATNASMTAAADLGGKSPLALRVEQAMNAALQQGIDEGVKDPDELLQRKLQARQDLMDEVTGQQSPPVPKPTVGRDAAREARRADDDDQPSARKTAAKKAPTKRRARK